MTLLLRRASAGMYMPYKLNMISVDWKSSLDNGNNIGTIAVDLSKAFDSLPHGLLVVKLFAYGVTLPASKLLCSYLPVW